MLCLPGNHLTGLAIPYPALLTTYCGTFCLKQVAVFIRRKNTRRPGPGGPCREDAGARFAPRSADVTTQAWLVKDILQELVPHLPNLHFCPLGPHPVLLPLQSPQLQTYLRSFPWLLQASRGPVCKVLLPSLGFCSASLAGTEVKAGRGSKCTTVCPSLRCQRCSGCWGYQHQRSQGD